jgi:hypothetical protein
VDRRRNSAVLADGSRQGVSGPAEQSRKSGRGTARGRGIQGGQSTSGGEQSGGELTYRRRTVLAEGCGGAGGSAWSCGVRMGRRGSQGPIIGGSGDLGGAQRDTDPGELAGDLGLCFAAGRKERGRGIR